MAIERGFTMVELIMVIVLIGILAAVAGPRFFDRRVFDERLFYEESLTAVRFAQKLAVASGCQIRAEVNNAGFALSYANACGGLAAGSPVKDPSGDSFVKGKPESVAVDTALNVTFTSLGAANGVANEARFAGGTFVITVDPVTGFIGTTP
jgi:MSHA pilin protein MshC